MMDRLRAQAGADNELQQGRHRDHLHVLVPGYSGRQGGGAGDCTLPAPCFPCLLFLLCPASRFTIRKSLFVFPDDHSLSMNKLNLKKSDNMFACFGLQETAPWARPQSGPIQFKKFNSILFQF